MDVVFYSLTGSTWKVEVNSLRTASPQWKDILQGYLTTWRDRAYVFVHNATTPDYRVAQTPLEGPCSIADVEAGIVDAQQKNAPSCGVYFVPKDVMAGIDKSLDQTVFGAYLFTPSLATLQGPATARIAALGTAIDAANAAGCDIFLGPEYFCASSAAKLGQGSGLNHCYDKKEFDAAATMVRGKAQLYPRMLIAAGTVFWIDDQRKVRNTLLLCCKSENLDVHHHKKLSHADSALAINAGGTWAPGLEQRKTFSFRNRLCCAEICADAEPRGELSLQLVSASGLGAVRSSDKRGVTLVADSCGVGTVAITDSLGVEEEHHKMSGKITFSFN